MIFLYLKRIYFVIHIKFYKFKGVSSASILSDGLVLNFHNILINQTKKPKTQDKYFMKKKEKKSAK